jgi:hypothetical protein
MHYNTLRYADTYVYQIKISPRFDKYFQSSEYDFHNINPLFQVLSSVSGVCLLKQDHLREQFSELKHLFAVIHVIQAAVVLRLPARLGAIVDISSLRK